MVSSTETKGFGCIISRIVEEPKEWSKDGGYEL